MWGRHGLGEIIVDHNEICFFKFKNIEGMNYVLEQSPWMVNGKPMVVQKWDPDVCIEKTDPCKIPIWIKEQNVPLEAWSIRGISTLASRLGRPILMDEVATTMCHKGTVSAAVFGHKERFCKKLGNGVIKYQNLNVNMNKVRVDKFEMNNEFVENKDKSNNTVVDKNVSEVKENGKEKKDKGKMKVNDVGSNDSPPSLEKIWSISPENIEKIRMSANKYILRKVQPTIEETKKWTYDMRQYFKYRWKALNRNEENNGDEDVILDENNATNDLVADEIGGSDNKLLN
ncbi:RNA-directed DNA polymerase, eukaryota, reverse transcriptase zinc-binding domain protein [Tanacetum coccineum]